jgi:hypothetical protein
MYPDHLEVTVSGVPRLNVMLEEVGLTGGQFRGAEVPELPPWMAAPAVAGRRVKHRAPRCPGTDPR